MRRRIWAGLRTRCADDTGAVGILSAAVGLIVLIMAFASLTNVGLNQYQRATLRSGLHEAVSTASRTTDGTDRVAACKRRFRAATDPLLADSAVVGEMRCRIVAGRVVAEVDTELAVWAPFVSGGIDTLRASANVEERPA